MRLPFVLLAVVLASGAAAVITPAAAQPPVVWEPLPSTAQTVNENAMVTALALAEAPGGGTAVYVHAGRTYRLDDDERDWTPLDLGAPEAVTVTVFDARGRAVWASGAGPARGEHAWEIDASAWAAGVYVVRAEIGGGAVSARLTVAR
ncbi:T9SS type A sorting domain-containing protein [Rubricoccus marinus]|uniref:Secretion system C-terminal sorting domain-containing protein n=1 Tax=Rubricoccus marinus TaxID=716817 RepID=A0A259TW15_9BACT|nr:T9SS type A sorting domain-containing protein [Rubricoccus marinus]OZC01911.1 hypothetical protein BSZ36_02255 [Rubricoccus marinus]